MSLVELLKLEESFYFLENAEKRVRLAQNPNWLKESFPKMHASQYQMNLELLFDFISSAKRLAYEQISEEEAALQEKRELILLEEQVDFRLDESFLNLKEEEFNFELARFIKPFQDDEIKKSGGIFSKKPKVVFRKYEKGQIKDWLPFARIVLQDYEEFSKRKNEEEKLDICSNVVWPEYQLKQNNVFRVLIVPLEEKHAIRVLYFETKKECQDHIKKLEFSQWGRVGPLGQYRNKFKVIMETINARNGAMGVEKILEGMKNLFEKQKSMDLIEETDGLLFFEKQKSMDLIEETDGLLEDEIKNRIDEIYERQNKEKKSSAPSESNLDSKNVSFNVLPNGQQSKEVAKETSKIPQSKKLSLEKDSIKSKSESQITSMSPLNAGFLTILRVRLISESINSVPKKIMVRVLCENTLIKEWTVKNFQMNKQTEFVEATFLKLTNMGDKGKDEKLGKPKFEIFDKKNTKLPVEVTASSIAYSVKAFLKSKSEDGGIIEIFVLKNGNVDSINEPTGMFALSFPKNRNASKTIYEMHFSRYPLLKNEEIPWKSVIKATMTPRLFKEIHNVLLDENSIEKNDKLDSSRSNKEGAFKMPLLFRIENACKSLLAMSDEGKTLLKLLSSLEEKIESLSVISDKKFEENLKAMIVSGCLNLKIKPHDGTNLLVKRFVRIMQSQNHPLKLCAGFCILANTLAILEQKAIDKCQTEEAFKKISVTISALTVLATFTCHIFPSIFTPNTRSVKEATMMDSIFSFFGGGSKSFLVPSPIGQSPVSNLLSPNLDQSFSFLCYLVKCIVSRTVPYELGNLNSLGYFIDSLIGSSLATAGAKVAYPTSVVLFLFYIAKKKAMDKKFQPEVFLACFVSKKIVHFVKAAFRLSKKEGIEDIYENLWLLGWDECSEEFFNKIADESNQIVDGKSGCVVALKVARSAFEDLQECEKNKLSRAINNSLNQVLASKNLPEQESFIRKFMEGIMRREQESETEDTLHILLIVWSFTGGTPTPVILRITANKPGEMERPFCHEIGEMNDWEGLNNDRFVVVKVAKKHGFVNFAFLASKSSASALVEKSNF